MNKNAIIREYIRTRGKIEKKDYKELYNVILFLMREPYLEQGEFGLNVLLELIQYKNPKLIVHRMFVNEDYRHRATEDVYDNMSIAVLYKILINRSNLITYLGHDVVES